MAARKNKAESDLFDDDEESGGGVEDEGQESEPDDEPSEPVEEGEILDEAPPSRRERRRNRVVEMAAEEAERRMNERLEARFSQFENLLRQNQGVQHGGAPQQNPNMERIKSALNEVYQRQDLLTQAWAAKQQAGNITQEEVADFTKQARDLHERREELIALRTMTSLGVGQQQRGPSSEEIHQDLVRRQAQAKHADIFSHSQSQQLITYADAHYMQRRALGAPDGPDLQDEAFDAARRAFGLQERGGGRRRPAPTKAEKARMGGVGGAGGGVGSSSGGTIVVTKELRKIAAAAYPHIKDERKRLEHHARMVRQKKG